MDANILKSFKNELSQIESSLSEIEKNNPSSLIDIDVVLNRIRVLYEDISRYKNSIPLKKEVEEKQQNIESVEEVIEKQEREVFPEKSEKYSKIENTIGLNDQLLFIRELFNGDVESYNTNIKKIDSMNSFKETADFINSNFSWDKSSEAYQFLVQILERKFDIS